MRRRLSGVRCGLRRRRRQPHSEPLDSAETRAPSREALTRTRLTLRRSEQTTRRITPARTRTLEEHASSSGHCQLASIAAPRPPPLGYQACSNTSLATRSYTRNSMPRPVMMLIETTPRAARTAALILDGAASPRSNNRFEFSSIEQATFQLHRQHHRLTSPFRAPIDARWLSPPSLAIVV